MQKEKYLKLIGNALLRKLPSNALIVFYGSLIKGGFSRTSDIDVAIFCGEKLPAKILMEIEKELESLPILRTVEVVDLGRVENPVFIEKVISEGLIWKSSEDVLNALKKRIESLKKQ